MDRRTFLSAVGLTFTVSAAGCMGSTADSNSDGTTTSDGGLTATVVEVSGDVSTYDSRQFSEGSIDCENETATISGVMLTSGCHTVAIDSLERNRDQATLVLVPEWDGPGEPGSVQCLGYSYDYTVRLESAGSLPRNVSVVYDDHDTDRQSIDTVTFEDC